MSTNRSQMWITRRTGRHVDGTLSIPKTFWNGTVPCSRTSKSRLKAAFSKDRHFAFEEQEPDNPRTTIAVSGRDRISTMINICINYFTKRGNGIPPCGKIRKKFTNFSLCMYVCVCNAHCAYVCKEWRWSFENRCLKRKTEYVVLPLDRCIILVNCYLNRYVVSGHWYKYDTFMERDKKILGRTPGPRSRYSFFLLFLFSFLHVQVQIYI